MTNQLRALTLIVLVAFIGAGTGVAVKLGVQNLSPTSFVAFRALLSLVLISPLIVKTKFWRTKNIFSLLAFSTLATANIVLYALGIGQTSVSIAATLYALVPLLTATFSWVLYREKLSFRQILGIFSGLTGAILIILVPVLSHGSLSTGSLSGNLIIALAVFIFSIHTTLSKAIQKQFSPLSITQAFILTASVILLPFAIREFQTAGLWLYLIQPKSILALLYVSFLGTVGFYFLYQYVIKKTSPLMTSLILYLQPVFAVVMGIILFHETLTAEFIIGTTFVFLGVWLSSSK